MIEQLGNVTATLSQQISGLQQGSPQRRWSPASRASCASKEEGCQSVASPFIPNQLDLSQNASAAKQASDQLAIETTAPAPALKRPSSLMPITAVARHPKKAHIYLSHSSVAESAGDSCKKIPLSEVICDLYRCGHLKRTKETLRSISLTHLSEKAKYRAAIELVECVVSDEQWIELCTPGLCDGDTIVTAKGIKLACLLQQWLVSQRKRTFISAIHQWLSLQGIVAIKFPFPKLFVICTDAVT